MEGKVQQPGCFEGSELTVTATNGKFAVKDASVIAAELDTCKGVINGIAKALLPPSGVRNIVNTQIVAGNVKTLAAASTKAGHVDSFTSSGPSTAFGLVDEALAVPARPLGVTAGQLLARDDLADIPKYHVVAGHEVMSTEMKAGAKGGTP